ncbi:sorbosone dehydrogenase [Allostella vacuolata]|nr:sorbosone dehydrogenase [Stella vacuolata]
MSRIASLPAIALAGGCLLLAGCGEDDFDVTRQYGPDPVLPAPATGLLPDLKVAEVVGWQDGQTPTVPDGLVVTAYARDLANPRTVHTLPNGDVLVVQSKAPPGKPLNRPKDIIRGMIMAMAAGSGGGGKDTNLITLLRDTDRDGQVDARSDLLTGLTSPFGVAWYQGTLYVAAADAILAYPYALGQSRIDAPPTVLTPLPGGPINHHWTKDLALSPDGRFLYASVGSNSNAGERGIEAEKGRAAIWQVDRATGAARVFASGLRNPNGLNIHPETGALWTVVNERDELGPNLVPDYLTSVREGGFYGWPWSYYGQHVDRRVAPPRPDLVAKAIRPDYALTSHVAALGLAFTNDSAMPEAYRNGAFVGNRGSWNRSAFNGYKVIYIPFTDGRPSGMPQDVVTGFLDGDRARGRPVGLAIDGTGALLIADDAGNTVWRVAAADGSVTPQPIPSDRVAGEAGTGTQATTTPPPIDAARPTAGDPPLPSQTDIAPAVGPEDGAARPRAAE